MPDLKPVGTYRRWLFNHGGDESTTAQAYEEGRWVYVRLTGYVLGEIAWVQDLMRGVGQLDGDLETQIKSAMFREWRRYRNGR